MHKGCTRRHGQGRRGWHLPTHIDSHVLFFCEDSPTLPSAMIAGSRSPGVRLSGTCQRGPSQMRVVCCCTLSDACIMGNRAGATQGPVRSVLLSPPKPLALPWRAAWAAAMSTATCPPQDSNPRKRNLDNPQLLFQSIDDDATRPIMQGQHIMTSSNSQVWAVFISCADSSCP